MWKRKRFMGKDSILPKLHINGLRTHPGAERQSGKAEPQRDSGIIVAVRVRPLTEDEEDRGEESIVFCPDQSNLLLAMPDQEKMFAFDAVLGPYKSQEAVFDECGMTRLIDAAMQGFSSTVFAFGQTGSGKTYTITGPHSLFLDGPYDPGLTGLMQRVLGYLLEKVKVHREEFDLCASYLEIYNEQVRDLLNPLLPGPLSLRGSRARGFYVENLSEERFHDLDGFMRLLEGGMQNRQTSSLSQNENSSRSHSILTVYVQGASSHGKLCVVDLAGSERVREGDSTEEQLEETGNINRSLLALGKCISALVDPKKRSGHIPYRDSKLTMLLSDSLGGSGITLMIACVSPTIGNLQETLNTLRYSSRARRIQNRPMAKRDLREKLVVSLRREISRLREENTLLRRHLASPTDRLSEGPEAKHCGSPSPLVPLEEGWVGRTQACSSSSCSDASLKSLLQELVRENHALHRDKLALLDSQESFNQQRAQLSQENSRLLRKLEDLGRVISSSPTDSSSSGLSMQAACAGGGGPHYPLVDRWGHLCPPVAPRVCRHPGDNMAGPPSKVHPWHPVHFCCGCSSSDNGLNGQDHGQRQKGRGYAVTSEEAEPFYKAPCYQEMTARNRWPMRNAIVLPALQEGPTHRAAPGPDEMTKNGQQHKALGPGAPTSLPRWRKGPAEGKGYAERYQEVLETRSQRSKVTSTTSEPIVPRTDKHAQP